MSTRDTWPTVASVPVRDAGPNALFLQMHAGDATLPSGVKVAIGTTCGLGGVSLILGVEGGTTLVVDAHDVLDALIAAGVIK